jgi:Xaa-Pro aminopeptidase
MPRLIEIDWPDLGPPPPPPPLTAAELHGRLANLRARCLPERAGEAHLVAVYGDREHAANLHWLTGFDPRFEEALLIVSQSVATLLVGNECVPYALASPLAAAGQLEVLHVPALSLNDQPRDGLRLAEALARAVPPQATVGCVGWKVLDPAEFGAAEPLDLPGFLIDALRERVGPRGRLWNATSAMMNPRDGLRTTVTAEGIARLDFANHAASAAVRRVLFSLREGMTDWDAMEAARLGGLPLSCHPAFATNGRPGLGGPSGEVLRRGEVLSFNIGVWGANVCRAGWVARDAGDLPPAARRTVEDWVGPYFECMSEWCALMRPGIAGGQIWEHVMNRLPPDLYGITLNPGHLIGLDEWLSSPVFRDSDVPLRAGMAMQMDVIPSHPVHGTTRLEDGYVIIDEAIAADLERRFPEVARRGAARADFLRDVLGMDVPPTLLPMGDSCGLLAPYLLEPRMVLTLR